MSFELSLVAAIGTAIGITAYMAFALDEQHKIVKALLFFLSYFSILGLFQVGNIIIETTAGASTRYTPLFVGFMWIYGFFGVILTLYLGWYLLYGVTSQIKDSTQQMLRMK